MRLSKLYEYLLTNGVTPDNHQIIRQELEVAEGDIWQNGYTACLRHNKKRKAIHAKRCDTAMKKFLDYLSDITHK